MMQMMIPTKPCVRNTKSSSLDSGSDAEIKWRRRKRKRRALLFKTKRSTSDLSLWPARALWAVAEAVLIFSFSHLQKFILRISHLRSRGTNSLASDGSTALAPPEFLCSVATWLCSLGPMTLRDRRHPKKWDQNKGKTNISQEKSKRGILRNE